MTKKAIELISEVITCLAAYCAYGSHSNNGKLYEAVNALRSHSESDKHCTDALTIYFNVWNRAQIKEKLTEYLNNHKEEKKVSRPSNVSIIILEKQLDLTIEWESEGRCFGMVADNGYNLKYVPSKLKTEEICRIAVEEDRVALKYVPTDILRLWLEKDEKDEEIERLTQIIEEAQIKLEEAKSV